MFCTHCGASLQADQRFCGSCGTSAAAPGSALTSPVTPAPVATVRVPSLGRVGRHVRMLGVLWIALSAIHLLRGGGRSLGARMVGLVARGWSDDVPWGWPVGHVVPAFLSFTGLISLVLAALGFVAGWGLLERRPWARTLAIVVAIIALVNPILATILGIYTLWVLLPSDAEAEWRRDARAV
jgi:zinc-ribbon domain